MEAGSSSAAGESTVLSSEIVVVYGAEEIVSAIEALRYILQIGMLLSSPPTMNKSVR